MNSNMFGYLQECSKRLFLSEKNRHGIDFSRYDISDISFDYNRMMQESSPSISNLKSIAKKAKINTTPMYYLKNITDLVRKKLGNGKGAKIYYKDESYNPTNSFHDRKTFFPVYRAKESGYNGVVSIGHHYFSKSLVSQARMRGIKPYIIDNDVFDKKHPLYKRIYKEFNDENVKRISFDNYCERIESTDKKYLFVSSHSPFAIAGVELKGYEIIEQIRYVEQRDPDYIVSPFSFGGNVTGTARGMMKAKTKYHSFSTITEIIGCAVNQENSKMVQFPTITDILKNLMCSDGAFLKRSASRPLRYLDRFLTVKEGDIIYCTELLRNLEGLSRDFHGNIALAVAIYMSMQLEEDKIIVVDGSIGNGDFNNDYIEYCKSKNYELVKGDSYNLAEKNKIIVPEDITDIYCNDVLLNNIKEGYIDFIIKKHPKAKPTSEDFEYLSYEIGMSKRDVKNLIFDRLSKIKKEGE